MPIYTFENTRTGIRITFGSPKLLTKDELEERAKKEFGLTSKGSRKRSRKGSGLKKVIKQKPVYQGNQLWQTVNK